MKTHETGRRRAGSNPARNLPDLLLLENDSRAAFAPSTMATNTAAPTVR